MEWLTDYKSQVETQLDELLSKKNFYYSAKSELLESIRYSVLAGGKRFRAVLSLITAEALINSPETLAFHRNPASGLALAIELVHSGSLIHDDMPCMDDDDLRRGKASNHIAFGEATALLAGDMLIIEPVQVLINYSTGADPRILNQVSAEFIEAIKNMIEGQALDIKFSDPKNSPTDFRLTESKEDLDHSLENLQKMQELKTGALINASIQLAAKLSGADKKQLQSLKIFSENLGYAFQIVDDILDHTAQTDDLGKNAGKDVEQNKLTYISLLGLEAAKEKAENLIKEAKDEISDINIYTEKLNAIADFVLTRES